MPLETMPADEPTGWKERRSRWTWGMFFLALAVSLLLQWVAQILAGGIVGAMVGIEGLAEITPDEFANLNLSAWWSTGIITVIVVASVTVNTSDDWTWSRYAGSAKYGMDWRRTFSRPVLIGAAVHGVYFGIVMATWTQASLS